MRLVILDRDGVINRESDAYIKSPDEWIPLPGSLEAIADLNRAGFTVVVASNQSGIGRGLYGREALERIHHRMNQALAEKGAHLDGIFFCPHHPDDHCDCRKPKPGLLNQISAQFKVPLDNVPVIGDSLRDLEAARAVGARPILVRSGYGERTLQQLGQTTDTEIFPDLAAAAAALIRGAKS